MPRPRRLLLLGHPVAHSLSPRFQQVALDASGIALRYEALDVAPAHFADRLRQVAAEGAAGNVTVPHKQAALDVCDVLTPLAAQVGAVNTFWTDAEGRLHGDNTDVGGFVAAVRAMLGRDLAGLQVALIGVGGAALAVRAAVEAAPGARLLVLARRAQAAREFAAPMGARARVVELVQAARSVGGAAADDSAAALEALRANLADVDLVVNATPLGLEADDPFPLPPELLPAKAAVLDLTYRREGTTAWVAACRTRGLVADDGLRMLVEQGALAFERWFERPAPRAMMLAAVGR